MAQEPLRLPIIEKGLYGFIDAKGKLVVEPKYSSYEPFSEGLAIVRDKGLYGYIDVWGNCVVPHRYDFASSFIAGFAIVGNNGNKTIIDKTGKEMFSHAFADVSDLNAFGLANVKGKNGRLGLINTRGELLLDTAYNFIGQFEKNGLCLVQKGVYGNLNGDSSAVLTKDAKWLIPFGAYKSLYISEQGLIVAENWEEELHYIDHEGKLLLSFEALQGKPDLLSYDEEKGILLFYEYYSLQNTDKQDAFAYRVNQYNLKTAQLKQVENIRIVREFIEGIGLLVAVGEEHWLLDQDLSIKRTFDPSFRLLSNGRDVREIAYKNSKGEMLFTLQDSLVHVVDTKGSVRLLPSEYQGFFGYSFDKAIIEHHKPNPAYKGKSSEYLLGFYHFETGYISPAEYKKTVCINDSIVLLVCKDSRYAYMDCKGNLIWKQLSANKSGTLDVSFKRSGQYLLERTPPKNRAKIFEWYEKNAYDSHKLPFAKQLLWKDSVVLQLVEAGKNQVKDGYLCFQVRLYNAMRDTVYLLVDRDILSITMEAKDPNGVWRAIEFKGGGGGCGRSDSRIPLPNNEFWEMFVPRYSGSFATELRCKLQVFAEDDYSEGLKDNGYVLYSNSIKGSINIGQFWYYSFDKGRKGLLDLR